MSRSRKTPLDPFEVEIDEKFRRRPGQFLRQKFLQRGFYVMLVIGCSLGLLVAYLTHEILVPLLGLEGRFTWVLLYWILMCLAFVAFMTYSKGGWSFRNLLKGMESESIVADVIERSMLQVFGCFVVNDVLLHGGLGNIDHIVVTPGRVLVIETKYRRLKYEYFQKAMRRIVGHVHKIEQYLGADVDVVGCLVLVHPSAGVKNSYSYAGRTIRAFKLESLKRFLDRECSKPRTLNEDVLQKVAQLGFDESE